MSGRRKCDGGRLVPGCGTWPAWKVRAKGETLERNWLYACGRHLNQVAQDWAGDAGTELDLVRIRANE